MLTSRPSQNPKSEARNPKQTAMIKMANSKHREEGHVGLTIEWALPFCSFLPAEKKSKKAEPSQRMRLCVLKLPFGILDLFRISSFGFRVFDPDKTSSAWDTTLATPKGKPTPLSCSVQISFVFLNHLLSATSALSAVRFLPSLQDAQCHFLRVLHLAGHLDVIHIHRLDVLLGVAD